MKRSAYPILFLLLFASCKENPVTGPSDDFSSAGFHPLELKGNYGGYADFYVGDTTYREYLNFTINENGYAVGGGFFDGPVQPDANGVIHSSGTFSYLYGNQRYTYSATLQATAHKTKLRFTGTMYVRRPGIDSARFQFSQGLTSVAFLNENTILAAGTGGALLRSMDGGRTWRKRCIPEYVQIGRMTFIDDRHGVLVGETRNLNPGDGTLIRSGPRVFYTADGGTTLMPINLTKEMIGILGCLMVSPDVFFLHGYYGSWYTTDRGTTWNGFTIPLQYSAARLFRTHPERYVLMTVNGQMAVHLLVDTTWTTSYRYSPTFFTAGDMSFFNSSLGAACGTQSIVALTTNGGETWTESTTGATSFLWSIAFASPSIIVAGGYGEMVRSADGGETWTRIALSPEWPVSAISFISPRNGVAVGPAVLLTDDGGLTWREP